MSLRVGDVEIETIDAVEVHVEAVHGAIVGAALKTPIAVIVRTPAGHWRVDYSTFTGMGFDDSPDEFVMTNV